MKEIIERLVLVGLVGPWAGVQATDNLAFDIMSPVVRLEAPKWSGSGFAVARGKLGTYILTNNHVIEGLQKINVKIFYWNLEKTQIIGWYMVEGKVVARSSGADLGLVLIPSYFRIPIAEIQDVPLRILDPAFAVGCGLGQDPQIYRGAIIDQDWDCGESPACAGLVQMDCHIVKGCSGGPLFVQSGEKWVVVGVVCFGFSSTEMNYAVPAKKVLEFLSRCGTM